MRSETESLKTGRDYAKAEQRSRVLEPSISASDSGTSPWRINSLQVPLLSD